ncbi:MAG: hypothetical protein A3J72_09350, partial [Nitrospirae bacterium RIFCSPHIGHO2_02_FULL_40_19]
MNAKLKKIFKKYHVLFAIQYGSSLTSKWAEDIDLALYCQKPSQINTWKLYGELQPFFDRQLDLIILTNHSNPLLTYEILTKGKVLYMKSLSLFVPIVVTLWKRYLDTQKFRNLEKQ